MLKVSNLKFCYGNVEVLHDVSFEAQVGEITVLIGTNGAGKTTTMKAIVGLRPISDGKIVWQDLELNKMRPHMITKAGLSLCPEGRQLFPDMTVHENLLMGAYLQRNKKDIIDATEEVFYWFPRLKDRRMQLAGTLSGGEQEMLAIARALMAKPKLLLMDEPSWGLAPKLVEEVAEIIKAINKRGSTILLVEQNVQMALDIADYVYVLETGQIVAEGNPAILAADKQIHDTYLGI
ncbi:MAG: ABC transporter ATP-binding protein [Christensenellales bacterium]|jgi:branched-chain amino acid transport system ATP-binding protein